ncbi:twin-arginine translocase TatA/TatE family subunit [Mycetocola tolaasinivorans]
MIALVAIVLLLFGAPRLPALARSLGQSARILKSEIREAPATPGAADAAAESMTPTDSAGTGTGTGPASSHPASVTRHE